MEQDKEEKSSKPLLLAESAVSSTQINSANPWTVKLDDIQSKTNQELFVGLVNECRFFYKNEPLVSTVINKMVDIGVNDLVFSKNGLTDNEFKVFTSLKPKLLEFAEIMALEFLLSGLVVPEFSLGRTNKDDILAMGVKKYSTLQLPVSMFVRDPKSIVIYTSLMSDKPAYFVGVPEDVAYFINNKGKYKNGQEDKELYKEMKKAYPDFVKEVEKGTTEIPLENDNIIRRRYTSDNPYPIPFASAALDPLKHKRKLRQMDFSIADKVIGAMLHVKLGSDEFPISDNEESKQFVEDIRNQLTWRFNSKKDLERIFQLITTHTVEIKWVFPDTSELLNDTKYKDINLEILYALGFPKTLIIGESEKSNTGDPEMSMIGPVKTMENFRRKILEVLRVVCATVAKENNFKTAPTLSFAQLNLHNFSDLLNALNKLYEIGGLSRDSYDAVLGLDFKEQLEKRASEQLEIEKAGIPQVGLTPNSGNQIQNTPAVEQKNTDKSTKKVEKQPVDNQNTGNGAK